jgi:hypothetical protein
MVLAGCADMPGSSDYAMAPTMAHAQDDPSFRLSQLKGGMAKPQLDAIYGKRLVRGDGAATYGLYMVESYAARPGLAPQRERLALWVIDGRLATWGIVDAGGPVPIPPKLNALPPAPGQIAASEIHGRYGVQIAARPTQEEARAFIEDMRGKYASLLGRQWAVIYRVELPQGVFYRAVVGPFASESHANKLCGELKAKGEDCFLRQG